MEKNSNKALMKVLGYISNTKIPARYDIKANEVQGIATSSQNVSKIIFLAFCYGFEKGCRATKKAAKA